MLPECLRGGRWIRLSDFHSMLLRINNGAAPHVRTLRRWCKSGQISASRLGGASDWWIDVQALKTANEETREVYLEMVRVVNGCGE